MYQGRKLPWFEFELYEKIDSFIKHFMPDIDFTSRVENVCMYVNISVILGLLHDVIEFNESQRNSKSHQSELNVHNRMLCSLQYSRSPLIQLTLTQTQIYCIME